MNNGNKPLITIVGPTASGKSELAIQLACEFGGEIIAADSRTVYKGMNIGTAKPSKSDQGKIPHYLLDIVDPTEDYTVANFKRDALSAIKIIENRAKIPILVGGSGLYIDALLYDYQFRVMDVKKRVELNKKSLAELQKMTKDLGLKPEHVDFKNRRRLVRAIESNGQIAIKNKIRANTLILGLSPTKQILEDRIISRVNKMVDSGLIDEAKNLKNQYSNNLKAFDSTSYRPIFDYLDKKITLQEAKTQFIKNDKLLAKKQRTWFKRNKSIHWIKNREEAVALTTTFLNK